MKHYWINCINSTNRYKYMVEQFKNNGLDNKRIDAYTPKKLPIILKPLNCTQSAIEISCVCSHLKAIKQGLLDGDEWFIVMEDDVDILFDIDYDSLIKLATNNMTDKSIDIIQLYTSRCSDYCINKNYNNKLFIPWDNKMKGTCGYIINKYAAKKLLNMFVRNGIFDFYNIDDKLVADYVIYKYLNSITITYPLFSNNNYNTTSTIHASHDVYHNKITDSIKYIITNINPPEFCKKWYNIYIPSININI